MNDEIIKIKFSPGVWLSYFKDKETLDILTEIDQTVIHRETEIVFNIPDSIKDNKNAVLECRRIK